MNYKKPAGRSFKFFGKKYYILSFFELTALIMLSALLGFLLKLFWEVF